MKSYPNWIRKVIQLHAPNNCMACVSRNDGEWFYFSRSEHGSLTMAFQMSDEFMRANPWAPTRSPRQEPKVRLKTSVRATKRISSRKPQGIESLLNICTMSSLVRCSSFFVQMIFAWIDTKFGTVFEVFIPSIAEIDSSRPVTRFIDYDCRILFIFCFWLLEALESPFWHRIVWHAFRKGKGSVGKLLLSRKVTLYIIEIFFCFHISIQIFFQSRAATTMDMLDDSPAEVALVISIFNDFIAI